MAARGRKEREIDSAALPISPLGATIRALRRKQGLSLTDLAQRAGLHSSGRSYLSKIEHGHITRLGQRQLGRLADALSVSSDQLAVVMHQTLAAKMAQQDRETAAAGSQLAASADRPMTPPPTEHAAIGADTLGLRRVHPALEALATELTEEQAGSLVDLISHRVVEQLRPELQTLLGSGTPSIDAPTPGIPTPGATPALTRVAAHSEARRDIGPAVVAGPEPVAAAAIRLVRYAAEPSASADGPIIITWLRDNDLFASVPHLWAGWQAALRAAIESGRTIMHLVRHSRQRAKAPIIVDYIRTLLGTSSARALYTPIIVSQLDQGGLPDECVLVPGHGALVVEATESATATIARLEPPGGRFDALYAATMKLREAGTPVYKDVWPRPSSGFLEAITRAEQASGSRYLLMNGLSESTVPIASHEWRAHAIMAQKGVDVARIQSLLAHRKVRAAALARTLTTYRVRDFCPSRAIGAYVETGVYSSDDALLQLAVEPIYMGHAHIERHLDYLLARLMINTRYQLILLDDSEAELCRSFCMVKYDTAVLLECWLLTPTGERQQIDIEITEPSIVKALSRDPFWTERAADEDAERRRSVEVLRSSLRHLRRKIG